MLVRLLMRMIDVEGIIPLRTTADNKNATVNDKKYQVEYLTATKENLQPKMLSNSNVKLSTSNYNAQLTSNKPDSLKYLPDILYNAWNDAEDSIWKLGAKALDIYGWQITLRHMILIGDY